MRARAVGMISSIRTCDEAYGVATGVGADGPAKGKPVIIGNRAQSGRASVVFSRAEEMSAFVRRQFS